MEMKSATVLSLALAASSALAANLGPVGPRENPDDQYRFFWGLNEKFYPAIRDVGFNLVTTTRGAKWWGESDEERARSEGRHRAFAERVSRDGVDYMERIAFAATAKLIEKYPVLGPNGKPVGKGGRGTLDLHKPELQAYLKKVLTEAAMTYTNIPGVVGVQPASEVRDRSRPRFTSEYSAACRRDLGFDPPPEFTSSRTGGARMRPDFPPDGIVDEDYPPLRYFAWFWKHGDGWNDYFDRCGDIFSEVLGKEMLTLFDPVVRAPPLWGSGGSKLRMGNHWFYEEPEPYGVSFLVSEQMAMARGTPGMRVVTMLQGIAGRRRTAPKNRTVENPPAWVADRPNAKYITQPPDAVREALWMLFSRQVDGIGLYAYNALFDAAESEADKRTTAYQFTNPETIEAVREGFRKAGIPLGPLLKAIPERAPEVALLESYATSLLECGGNFGWPYNYGDLAVAANLMPSVIYEEEIARDGIPPSVKVILAPAASTLLRGTYKALVEFQKRGGVIAANEDIVPGILPDVALPDYLLTRYQRTFDSVRDRKMIHKGVRELRRDLAWAHEPYSDSANEDIVVHARTYRNADYVFAVNDRRTFGDYVGQWRIFEEKGLPNEAEVTVRRTAGAVYDLVRHAAVPFRVENGRTVIPVSYETTDGRILLVAPRPLAGLTVFRAGEEVVVFSPDKDVMIPIEVAVDGGKPRYGVVEDGVWRRPYPKGANLRVTNLADGRTASAVEAASVAYGLPATRADILRFFEENVYGEIPPKPAKMSFRELERGSAFGGAAERRQYAIETSDACGSHSFRVLVYLPTGAKKPVPAFAYPNFSGNHSLVDDPAVIEETGSVHNDKRYARGARADRMPVEEIVRRGFAVVTWCYAAMYPDLGHADVREESAKKSVYAIFPPERRGQLLSHSAWVWGAMRVRDLIETLPEIDGGKVGVVGQSRMGKSAALIGAYDERFAFVGANCGGAKKLRELPTLLRPCWFSDNLLQWASNSLTSCTREAAQAEVARNALPPPPYEQAAILACIAPRALFVMSATKDRSLWPEGAREVTDELKPVFERLGGKLEAYCKDDVHSIKADDWRRYMTYVESTLGWK